jgi:ganglioside GM2 activator
VSVLLDRKVGPFFVKVPCVDNFGSCKYANACEMWAQYCPKFAAQYGLPCQCPIPADIYSVSNANIFVNMRPPPELLGEYRATADFGSRSSHLGCVNIDLTVKN